MKRNLFMITLMVLIILSFATNTVADSTSEVSVNTSPAKETSLAGDSVGQEDMNVLLSLRKALQEKISQAKQAQNVALLMSLKQQLADINNKINAKQNELNSAQKSNPPSDENVITDKKDIPPITVVTSTETIGVLLNKISKEPSNEDLYKTIGILYSKENEKGFKVFINGSLLDFTKTNNVPPTISHGRVNIPIRAFVEALGGKVDWNPSTSSILITLDNTMITLKLNSETAFVNGLRKTLEIPAISIEGRTMIPLRFVGESLGKKIGWYPNSETNVISVT